MSSEAGSARSAAPIVIVGGGLAAASAAHALREYGYDGELVLISEEDEHPYERPPLSKAYLAAAGTGDAGAGDDAELIVHPAEWYGSAQVELRLGSRVTAVRPAEHAIDLADGSSQRYGSLLLATGGRPSRLGQPHSERIHHLRTRADADRLGGRLSSGGRLLVIGAGFVGCEVAATARRRGVDVVVLEGLDNPLQRVLGDAVGAVLGGVHRDQGVELHTGVLVESITETADGLVVHTKTSRGTSRLECTDVLVAIGMRPNVELLAGSSIAVADGVLVDEYCRTSAPDVFAAGDVAAAGGVRVEHYDNAIKQGGAAAANMLGLDQPYHDPHWFWSDQYHHQLQSIGVAESWDDLVIRGSLEDRSFAAFYLLDGRLQAVVALDRPRDVLRSRKLVASRAAVDRERLADESIELRKVAVIPA